MPNYGVFVDPSGYRRTNLDFDGQRLTALADIGCADWITLLQTDVSVSEIKNLIHDHVQRACDALKASQLSVFKSIADDRLDIFKKPPDAAALSTILVSQFEEHLERGCCLTLDVSDVSSSTIFADYFGGAPPFDNTKKKHEFPDAFTLKRLIRWADRNETTVYVVGPDHDLKRVCDVQDRLQHFEKIEMLLDHINPANALVQKLHERPQAVMDQLEEFVTREFANRMFVPEYNLHGDVENVEVSEVEIGDAYALEVGDDYVLAEADAAVSYSADVSYEDLHTGFYDKETGRYYMTDYGNVEVEEKSKISLVFNFSVEESGKPLADNISITEDTISVREEDRGDYGFYK